MKKMGFWYGKKIRAISKKLDFSSKLCYLLGSIACAQKSYFYWHSFSHPFMIYFLHTFYRTLAVQQLCPHGVYILTAFIHLSIYAFIQ